MSIYSDKRPGISFRYQKVLKEEIASQVAAFFSAFSDTSRVKIVSVLCEGRLNVGRIAQQVGISESAVSHHLRTLRQLRSLYLLHPGSPLHCRMRRRMYGPQLLDSHVGIDLGTR